MDEGLKRKLVGAVVLMGVALIVLPQITPKTQNVEYLSKSVPLEQHIPAMDMPLPKSLSIPVSSVVASDQKKGVAVPMHSLNVDLEKLKVNDFEVPVRQSTGQAVVWHIQVASFARVENALKLRDKLRKSGYKAFEKLSRDGIHTRVFIGPSTQKTELERQLKEVQRRFKLKGKVLPFQDK